MDCITADHTAQARGQLRGQPGKMTCNFTTVKLNLPKHKTGVRSRMEYNNNHDNLYTDNRYVQTNKVDYNTKYLVLFESLLYLTS